MQSTHNTPTLSVEYADVDPDGTPKPRTLVPAIQVLPSPPLTREASLASADGQDPSGDARESLDGLGQARPRPPRTSEEGAPTAAEVDLGEQHFLRTSQPFLDMNSYQGSSIHSAEINDMANVTLADDIIDISGATDVETGYGAGPSMAGPSRQRIEDHPLAHKTSKRMSTPIWELELPPADNNVGTFTTADTQAYQTLRSKPSRPLVPKSSYYFGPPPADAAYGSNPVGKLGTHHPREVIRLERDYTGGELIQFSSAFPLELEGRITPTQFLESVNSVNEILIAAHSLRHAALDNAIEIFSLQLSRLFWVPYYERQMRRLRRTIDTLNTDLFNPAGLNILWPRQVAFLFMEIEYY